MNFVRAAYPEDLVVKKMIQEMERYLKPDSNKSEYEFVLKIPYVT